MKTKNKNFSPKHPESSEGENFFPRPDKSLVKVENGFKTGNRRCKNNSNFNENSNYPGGTPLNNRRASLRPIRRRLFSDSRESLRRRMQNYFDGVDTPQRQADFQRLYDFFGGRRGSSSSSGSSWTLDSFDYENVDDYYDNQRSNDRFGSLRRRMQNYFDGVDTPQRQADFQRLHDFFGGGRGSSSGGGSSSWSPSSYDSFDTYDSFDDVSSSPDDRFGSLRRRMHGYFDNLDTPQRQADFQRLHDFFGGRRSSSSSGSPWTMDSFDYGNVDDYYGIEYTPPKGSKESLRRKMQRYFNTLETPQRQRDLIRLHDFFRGGRGSSTPSRRRFPSDFDYSFDDDSVFASPGSPSYARSMRRLFSGSQFTPNYGSALKNMYSSPYTTPRRRHSSPSYSSALGRLFSGPQSASPNYGSAIKSMYSSPYSTPKQRSSSSPYYSLHSTPKRRYSPSYSRSLGRLFSGSQFTPNYGSAIKSMYASPYFTPKRRYSSPSYSRSLGRLFSGSQFTPNYGSAIKSMYASPYSTPKRRYSSPSYSRSLGRLFSGSQFTPNYGSAIKSMYASPYSTPKRRYSSPSYSRSLGRLFSGSQFTPNYGSAIKSMYASPYSTPKRSYSPSYSRSFNRLFSGSQFTPNYGSAIRSMYPSPYKTPIPEIPLIIKPHVTRLPAIPQIMITADDSPISTCDSAELLNRGGRRGSDFLSIPSWFRQQTPTRVTVPYIDLSSKKRRRKVVSQSTEESELEPEEGAAGPSIVISSPFELRTPKESVSSSESLTTFLSEMTSKKKKKGIVKSLSNIFKKKKKYTLYETSSEDSFEQPNEKKNLGKKISSLFKKKKK